MSKKLKWSLVCISVVLIVLGVAVGLPSKEKSSPPNATPRAANPPAAVVPRVREPAVAGLFYPKEKEVLSAMLDTLLAAAPAQPITHLKALICPHAGYPYSGPTAAYAYKNLVGREIQTVFILAPSHYALFKGASIPAVDVYRTPLGDVGISEKAKTLAKISPFQFEPRCRIQRPSWWPQSSKVAPAAGEDTPDTWEHSAEVQVPFLQKVLKNFTILPMVFCETDPDQAARVLAGQLDEKTLLIASSDLSHYHPYNEAKELDNRCVKAICDLDIETMQSQEACGKVPILVLMNLAKQKGWKTQLLDYRNSGDTSGDKSGVVGYAAIAFYAPNDQVFNPQERKQLLDLARKTLVGIVSKGPLPKPDAAGLPKKFTESKGCFVTLTKNGVLRGCIGHIFPQEPLYQAIMDNAQSSALRDPRFSPVQPDELDKIEMEISVLTVPQPLNFSSPEDLLNKLQPHKDGVVLQIGANGATYLPQVWEQLPDKIDFLSSLAQKAGCASLAWRQPGTKVSIYHVECFKESDK